MNTLLKAVSLAAVLALSATAARAEYETKVFDVGAYIHDIAPGPNGTVWWTAQRDGQLGILDPKTGENKMVKLGPGSRPHGIITGPDGAAWIMDGGQNAIVRYDPKDGGLKLWKLPDDTGYTNLNTSAFDGEGNMWFTGQNGFYGKLDTAKGQLKVWNAPIGRGAYGITGTPNGEVWFVSLASSYLGKINKQTGEVEVITPPREKAGLRRVWSDSKGDLWISEWNSGLLSRYSPATKTWKDWTVPGENAQNYAVYVDEKDIVWFSQWGANTTYSFDPKTEKFVGVPGSGPKANVRQILGRPGEVFLPESGTSRIMIVNTNTTKSLTQ
jgi:virginiamycin B lyase